MLHPSVGVTRDKPYLSSFMNPTVIYLFLHLCFLSCDLRILPAIVLLTDSGLGFEWFFFFIVFLERQLDLENAFDKPQIFVLRMEQREHACNF